MRAVHFGGGNIGRGFIGLLLAQAGYRLIFVDVNVELVRLLQERREYEVWLANSREDRTVVRNVTAIDGRDAQAVAQAVAEADLVTTAVGVNVLPGIAGTIAQGIERRLASSEEPLHIIACENAIGASTQLKRFVYERLSEEMRDRADRCVAFPDSAVDRIVPNRKHEDPLRVTVEPFFEWVIDRTAIMAGLPDIPDVHYADALQPFIERKLFTVNTGHCTAAYHAYLGGYDTIHEAMADPNIEFEVRGAVGESGAALVRRHGFDAREHAAYVEAILDRFRNPHLTDEVVRVGRSPIRKLSPDDRLLRPARAAAAFGIATPYLARAMAAALLFDYAEDAEAAELQRTLQEQDVSRALTRFTGLSASDPLHAQVIANYEVFKERQQRTKGGVSH